MTGALAPPPADAPEGAGSVRSVLLLLALAISTGGILVGALGPGLEDGDRMWPVVWLLWGFVGYLILRRRPGNGVGIAMLGIGVAWGASFGLLTLAAITGGSTAAWAELGNTLLGVLPWLGIIWLLLVYPSGVLAGRAERVVALTLVVLGSVLFLAFAGDPAPMEESGVPSPLAISALGDLASALTGDHSFGVIIVLVLATLGLLIARSRRSTGVERLQFRWLMMGAVAFLLVITAGQFFPDDSNLDWLWLLGGAAIPAAIGVAILRYRLYDIDHLVSRTVTYLCVVGFLAAVFFAVVTAASSLLSTDSDLAIAGSTLAVAALFNPVRRRVQGRVDRRFNRSRYDTQRVVDALAGTLRDRVDTGEVVGVWTTAVVRTMQPASVAVWVRNGP